MRDLFSSPIFSEASALLEQHGERIKQADMVHISAPASLEGVLALGQLKQCLDVGLKYRRRLFTSRHHLPRDAPPAWSTEESGLSVIVDAEEATWEVGELQKQPHVHLVPLTTSVELGNTTESWGASIRLSKQRPLQHTWHQTADGSVDYVHTFRWGSGGAMDTSMDPIHTTMLNHLKEEGSVRIVPLPEVKSPSQGMLPGLPERQLTRLSKVWSTMDVDERSLALSELILSCLTESELSTPRLEELVWHRMVVGEEKRTSQAKPIR